MRVDYYCWTLDKCLHVVYNTSEETQETYSYLTMLYKSEEAFWLLQFVCDAEQYEKLESKLFQYAASVTFASREAE